MEMKTSPEIKNNVNVTLSTVVLKPYPVQTMLLRGNIESCYNFNMLAGDVKHSLVSPLAVNLSSYLDCQF